MTIIPENILSLQVVWKLFGSVGRLWHNKHTVNCCENHHLLCHYFYTFFSSFLLLHPQDISFSKVFDLPSSIHNGHSNPTKASGDMKLTNGIIEQVALTGDTLNIYDAQNDPRFDKDLDKATGFHTKSILCMPIRDNKYQIIGKSTNLLSRGIQKYMTWSRGISRMSVMLILRYWQKQCSNSLVLYWL